MWGILMSSLVGEFEMVLGQDQRSEIYTYINSICSNFQVHSLGLDFLFQKF